MPSKLQQMQLQFRQKLMQEKEERMIKIHTDSQQKALSKVTRYDSHPSVPPSAPAVARKPAAIPATQSHQSPVKKSSPGVDRSRPLPPIQRESKNNNYQVSRSQPSTTSSQCTSSMRVAVHNGVRSRSAEIENEHSVANRTNGRVKQKTDIRHHEETPREYLQQVNHSERKSPEFNSVRPKQLDLHRAKTKTNHDTPSKVTNGHVASLKSSNEQRTMAGNTRNAQTTNANTRGKVKPTVSNNVSRKPVAKSRTVPDQIPARKPPNPNQEQCRYCGRNFNKDRIDKHVAVCAKSSQKKVKVFDATKMRVSGTEAESFVRKGFHSQNPKVQPKKSNWKKQHEDFINTIRQAKVAQRHLAAGGKLSDLPPPPPSDTSSYVQCPHCKRKFDEGVAQRHIPKCKNIQSNKKTPPKRK